MNDKAVEFINISKIYPDGKVALKNINLTIFRNEIHGILGENGAGKTTLMRILFGEIKPTRGIL
jgi:nucleoside ABC transporter ATP-binding protein